MTAPTPSSTSSHGRVLVVEDDPRIAEVARDYLVEAGFAVEVVDTGADALSTVARRVPDVVVLDLGLPDVDGLDVARELRRGTAVPIVMLTARTDELDRILGLEVGADDYVVKPFSPRELVARVRAVLRRVELDRRPDDRPLRVGPVVLDPATRRVTLDDEPVDLTATEFDLVAVLLSQPGRVFTRSQLLDAVHGAAFDSYERAVDAHVKNIRRKLEPTDDRPRLLQTVHGVGYRFVDG